MANCLYGIRHFYWLGWEVVSFALLLGEKQSSVGQIFSGTIQNFLHIL